MHQFALPLHDYIEVEGQQNIKKKEIYWLKLLSLLARSYAN